MRTSSLLLGTALGLVLATSTLAQSPSSTTSTNKDPAPTTQDKTQPSGASNPSPSNTNTTTPSSGSTTPSTAQTTPPSSTTTPNASGSAQTNPTNNPAGSQPTPSASNNNTAPTTPSANSSTQPSQAQSTPSNAAGQATPNASNQTGANAPAAGQPSTNNAANTNAPGNANVSVNINDQQRTQVTQAFARLNVQPLANVNFQVSVGTVVPRDVRLETVPADIVTIVPQYRGYSYFVVKDEIVIVEPTTLKIVTVLPRSGGSTASAQSIGAKVTFSDKDRAVIKKHASRPRTETKTTVTTTTHLRRGERVPETVELEEFPEEVYRESPVVRPYRYVHRDNHTYIVEPRERTIIEEID